MRLTSILLALFFALNITINERSQAQGNMTNAGKVSESEQDYSERKTELLEKMDQEISEMMVDQEQIGYQNVDSQGRLAAAGQLIEIATNTLAEAKITSSQQSAKLEEFAKVITQMHDEVHAMAMGETY